MTKELFFSVLQYFKGKKDQYYDMYQSCQVPVTFYAESLMKKRLDTKHSIY